MRVDLSCARLAFKRPSLTPSLTPARRRACIRSKLLSTSVQALSSVSQSPSGTSSPTLPQQGTPATTSKPGALPHSALPADKDSGDGAAAAGTDELSSDPSREDSASEAAAENGLNRQTSPSANTGDPSLAPTVATIGGVTQPPKRSAAAHAPTANVNGTTWAPNGTAANGATVGAASALRDPKARARSREYLKQYVDYSFQF